MVAWPLPDTIESIVGASGAAKVSPENNIGISNPSRANMYRDEPADAFEDAPMAAAKTDIRPILAARMALIESLLCSFLG